MHATESKDSSLDWLCNPKSKVSAHYLIDRDGTIYQLVAESQKAWHAGVSHWLGRDSVNDFSIGIEMSNKLFNRALYEDGEEYPEPFPEAQVSAAAALVADILRRRGLPLERVVGHSDIAPERRGDPGSQWDWNEFRRSVILFLHPDPDPAIVDAPRKAA
jgi:N-acetyl-anhydromuramyl-L-alanine amidase AmpD